MKAAWSVAASAVQLAQRLVGMMAAPWGTMSVVTKVLRRVAELAALWDELWVAELGCAVGCAVG